MNERLAIAMLFSVLIGAVPSARNAVAGNDCAQAQCQGPRGDLPVDRPIFVKTERLLDQVAERAAGAHKEAPKITIADQVRVSKLGGSFYLVEYVDHLKRKTEPTLVMVGGALAAGYSGQLNVGEHVSIRGFVEADKNRIAIENQADYTPTRFTLPSDVVLAVLISNGLKLKSHFGPTRSKGSFVAEPTSAGLLLEVPVVDRYGRRQVFRVQTLGGPTLDFQSVNMLGGKVESSLQFIW